MGNRRYIGFKNDAERTKRKERSPIPDQMERAISCREHLGTSVKHYTCTGKHGRISPETSRGHTKAQSCHSKFLPSTRRKNMSKQFCTQETSCLDRGVMSGMHAVYTFFTHKTFLYSPASRNTSTATELFRKLTNHDDIMIEASFISHGHD